MIDPNFEPTGVSFVTLSSRGLPVAPRPRKMDEATPPTHGPRRPRAVAAMLEVENGHLLSFAVVSDKDSFDKRRGQMVAAGRLRAIAENLEGARRAAKQYSILLPTRRACHDFVSTVRKAADDTVTGIAYAEVISKIISETVNS